MAPLTRKRKSEQALAALPQDEAPSTTESEPKKLPVRAKDGETPAETSTPAKGNLMVFGDDDEDVPAPVISKPAAPAPAADEEDDDSDDDAPEAVSTSKAASAVKKSAQVAQKAAQEQAATEKRKRRERDAMFKQQAEERKKLEEEQKALEEASKLASSDDDDEEEGALVTTQNGLTGRRRRGDREAGPNLLPLEFLEDSSEDEDEDEKERTNTSRRAKRRKVSTVEKILSKGTRGPRDEQVGSTVYRINKEADSRMAPKITKHAKSSREALLKRNRSAVKPRSGFFKK